jgi:hypothetical protein
MKTIASYFVNTDKLVLKFIWRTKELCIANTILKMNKTDTKDIVQSR